MASYTIKNVPNLGLVAVPSTTDQLGKFLALQRALNIMAADSGISPIGEDGEIGPGTLGLYNTTAGGKLTPVVGDVSSLAANAETYARVITSVLDINYDASIPDRMKRKPSIVTGSTPKIPGLPTPKGQIVWWVVGLLAVAGIATVGVLTYRRVKQRSRGPKTSF